ncbi:cytosolic Fe-S cluster assembly factor NUBP2 isoform X5 [Empidonax traillii]|nr:cytosolic Fe-S cluster assembly factor NUBP2 isoform X5 [Empidonax traillii]
MLKVQDRAVHQCDSGWVPVFVGQDRTIALMSIGFLLERPDDAVVWRGPKKNALIKQFVTDVAWGDLDFLIVDTPPGTSDEHISTVEALRPYRLLGAILVTTPQAVSVGDVRRELTFCRKTGLQVLGVVENMSGFVCPHCSGSLEFMTPCCSSSSRNAQTSSPKAEGRSWPSTPGCPSWAVFPWTPSSARAWKKAGTSSKSFPRALPSLPWLTSRSRSWIRHSRAPEKVVELNCSGLSPGPAGTGMQELVQSETVSLRAEGGRESTGSCCSWQFQKGSTAPSPWIQRGSGAAVASGCSSLGEPT